MTESQFTDPS